ncbi:cohesin domain-containing protein [Paenibacillus sp. YYML68]|uniref:cohesin domain-containing protein n=1 Tax=Paenibacillus sp. YYML68 TaxID=2909250 RepID=UPI00248F9BD1|nr:cohesin domain-containing protein [Paenibacillus sp. YYML68]
MILSRKLKQTLTSVLCMLLIVTSVIMPGSLGYAATSEDELPENIRIDKADFDTITETAAYYKSQFGDDAVQYFNSINGESRIKRINFLQYPEGQYLQVNGEVIIDIPARDARIWRLFNDVRFEGSVAQTMELYVIDPNGVETKWTVFQNGGWKDGITGLYTNYTKMSFQESNPTESIMKPWLVKDQNGNLRYDGYKMKIVGNGTLRSIYHWEEQGVPLQFDTAAWTVLGGDRDILNVTADVYALTNLSMNGVHKLPEDVFKRYHVNSGPIGVEQSSGSVTLLDEAYHKATNDWGFIPGRGAFHYKLMTENAGLKEDAARPGYADFTETNKVYARSQEAIDKFDSLYATVGKDYVLTLDGWPRWMWADPNSKESEHFGTPSYANFDAAADSAAKLIKSIDTRFDGRGPKYVEVKNESTIPQEWWFFLTHPNQAWDYLSEFHNKVATAVKAENPDVLVGGPSSAFMYFEKKGFDEARAQLKFMDDTKDTLDWYSHHFYENANLIMHDQESNPKGFLNGRMEAVLDLLNAHMVNTNNVKPIYITEEGTYNTGGTDIDYYQNLIAFNGYMQRFMNYSDSIGMLVPYLYPIINWRPNSNQTFYKYNETKNGLMEEMTPLEAYVDMWKDYRGAYLPSEADNERVFTNAVRYNDKVYVAVHNLNAQRVNLDLNVLAGNANIADVKRKHFYLEKGKLTYEEEHVADLNNVYMRVQEMSVFEITLDSNPSFTKTWERKFDYAPQELVPTSEAAPLEFTVAASTTNLAKSTLRVGFGKDGSGFTTDMAVEVNPGSGSDAQSFTKDLEFTNKSGDILTFTEFELDPAKVQSNNTIQITIPENGGHITSVQLINYYEQAAPTGTATTSLAQPIANAKAKLQAAVVSKTGAELSVGQKWVMKHIHNTLNIELTKADIVKNDALATADEIALVQSNLATAVAIFDKYTKTKGSSVGITGALFSFEDGEPISYAANGSGLTLTRGTDGVTKGSKALKAEFTQFTSYAWDSSGKYSANLDFAATDEGWNLEGKPIKFDVKNMENAAAQVRVEIVDGSSNKGTYYFAVAPNTSRNISISEFGVSAASWQTDGNFPRNAAIDTTNIKLVRFYVFAPTAAPLTKATITLDNVMLGNVQTGPAPGPDPAPGTITSFEDGEAVQYTYNNQAMTVTRGAEGATHGSKALKVDFNQFTAYTWDTSGKYSGNVDFTAPAEGWNLGGKPFKLDVKSFENVATQLRVEIADIAGNKGTYYFAIAPNASRNISISEFGVTAASWQTDGYYARSAAIDTTKLKSVKLYVFAPNAAPLTKATLAFDAITLANAATTPPVTPVLGTANQTVKAGTTFKVPVTLKNVKDLGRLKATVQYDSNVLTLAGVTFTNELPTVQSNDTVPGKVTFDGVNAAGLTSADATIAELTFTAKSGITQDVTAAITITGIEANTKTEVPYAMTAQTGTITVTVALTPGDVNDDGKVDGLDALKLMRHLANLATLTTAQVTAADYDGDGVLTASDALKMLKKSVGLIQ